MSASPLRAEQLKFRLLWIGIFAIMLLFASVTYPQHKLSLSSINTILLTAAVWNLIVFFTPLARALGGAFDAFTVFVDVIFITWVVRATGGFDSELTYLYFIELLLIAVFSERFQLLLGFLFSTAGLCSSLLSFQWSGIPSLNSKAILVRLDQWKQENLSALGVRTAGLVAVYLIGYLARLLRERPSPPPSIPDEVSSPSIHLSSSQEESTSSFKESRSFQSQSLNEQLSIIAHELRSPLTILRAYTDLLMDPNRQNGTEDIVSKIDAEVSQLSEMVSNLGALVDEGTSLRAEDFKTLNLIPLLRSLVDRYKSINDRHQFLFQTKYGDIPVRGDKIKLTRAFDNLLGNAVKYSPGGGRVSVTADIFPRRELGLPLSSLKSIPPSQPYAVVRISDSGIGISSKGLAARQGLAAQQGLSSAFEKFQRLDEDRAQGIPGSGLGLYLVRRIVEQHQGTVDLQSTEGKGTTVTVALPLGVKGESRAEP